MLHFVQLVLQNCFVRPTIHMRLGVTLCTVGLVLKQAVQSVTPSLICIVGLTKQYCKTRCTNETWCHTLYILFYSAVL